jgi:alpha-maltose-1-phosphate synthase
VILMQTNKEQLETRESASPSIFALTVFGGPFEVTSWSGSTYSLLMELRRRDVLQGAASADLSKQQKIASALRNLSFDKRRLYLDVMKSDFSFRARSANANKLLSNAQGFDTVLQISALFLPRREAGRLYCSYHDGNTAVSRDPRFSFMKAAAARVMRESWEYETKFYRSMDLVFTMSDWLRDSMIRDFGAAPERVVTVGAGVNLDYENELSSTPIPRDWSKQQILFIGTNYAFKGGPQLVEAFRRVRQQLPGATLKIVGCEPQLNEPGVKVVGVLDKRDPQHVRHLRDLFEESTAFALPTLYDAFGIAYVEAMYHQLPCVGSNRCAVPEIIEDGRTGFLIDPENPADIAQRLIDLLRDPKLSQQMGEAGYHSAKRRFSWKTVCDRMLDAMSTARSKA